MIWPENPRHPVYRVLRMGLVLGSLTVILALNASHFDITEIRALAWTFFSLIGVESVDEIIHKVKGHGKEENNPPQTNPT